VRFFGTGKRTQSLIMTTETHHVRFVDTVHVEGGPDSVVRFD
jgi:fructose-1,6-bisphosphatase II/fructose-1,6-bisphosphatase II / sedoheptulose-1,7-bisphosphatase